MSTVAFNPKWIGPPTGESVSNWTSEADLITLPRLTDVGGHVRPANIGVTYAECEYAALAHEQEHAWSAEAERLARSHMADASGLHHQVAAAELLMRESAIEIRAAHEDHQHAARVLTPYVRREPGAKLRYWVCWPLLVLGDTAGVWSAAIINGDLPAVAFGQALASGLAAACSGLVGSELKDMRMAKTRRRDPKVLTDDEQRYSRLFSANEDGESIVKLIGFLSVVVVGLVAVGVAALRTSIEGDAAGLTFGLLAAATAVASGLLGYSAADEVADLLATMAKRAQAAERRHLKLAASSAFKTKRRAEANAESIRLEGQSRGLAAAQRVDSLGFRVQRRNPQVVGHGYGVGEHVEVIGRRMRRGGGS